MLSEIFTCLFANSKHAVLCPFLRSGFSLATLTWSRDLWSAAETVVLLAGSPILAKELRCYVRIVIQYFVTVAQLLSFVRWLALGRVWVVPYSFHFLMMELTVLLGTFNTREIVLHPHPGSMPPHNSISEFNRQFLGLYGGVFALTCTFNSGTLRRKVCIFLNHVQSIELATGGLRPSCFVVLLN